MLESFGDEPKSQHNMAILVPMTLFGSIGVFCIFVFCLVRTSFVDIYSPRSSLKSGRPPKIPKGLLSWIPITVSASQDFMISTVGLDGVMLLRFFGGSAKFFGLLTLLGLAFVAPSNYFAQPFPKNSHALDEQRLLKALSIDNVPNNSPFLRANLLFTWVFSIVAYGFLVAYYRGYVGIRLRYYENVLNRSQLSKIETRTIMVHSIPAELRHEVDLAAYFEGLGIGTVENVVICRTWTRLRQAVSMRAFCLTKLEKIYADMLRRAHSNHKVDRFRFLWAWLGLDNTPNADAHHAARAPHETRAMYSHGDDDDNADLEDPAAESSRRPLLDRSSRSRRFSNADPADTAIFEIMSRVNAMDPALRPVHKTGLFGLFGQTIDSADYYAEQFRDWDEKVNRLRRHHDSSSTTAVGFVTFQSPESAIVASQAVIHRRPFACMVKMAPEPRDIYWANLSSRAASTYIKLLRSIFVYGTLFAIIFFSVTVISTVIVPLVSLDKLPELFPWTKEWIEHLTPIQRDIVNSALPAMILSAWLGLLPSLLIFLSQIQGIEAESLIESSVLSRLFFYQTWNVLIAISGSSLFISAINKGTILETLGKLWTEASPLLMNYVVLQALATYPAQLLLVAPVVLTWINRRVPWAQNSPRDYSTAYYPSILNSINYGIVYPVPLLIFVAGLMYGPMVPLILPFCTLFFAVAWLIYKYVLLYVHLPRYETNGTHVTLIVNRCLGGVTLMQLAMMSVLVFKHVDNKDNRTLGQAGSLIDDPQETLQLTPSLKVILAILPLLFLNIFVYWWLKNGYEAIVSHPPLEVIGKIVKAHSRSVQEQASRLQAQPQSQQQQQPQSHEDDVVDGSVHPQIRPEASPILNRAARSGNHGQMLGHGRNNLARARGGPSHSISKAHLRNSIGQELGATSSRSHTAFQSDQDDSEASASVDDGFGTPSEAGSSDGAIPSPSLSGADGMGIIHPQNTLDIAEPTATEEQGLVSDDFAEGRYNRNRVQHLEPPMIRVPGILDAPVTFNSALIPEGDEAELMLDPNSNEDMQVHTYIHPALIGRLPVAWIPGPSQPHRLVEARQDQARIQRETYRRIVAKQRAEIQVIDQRTDDEVEPAGRPHARDRHRPATDEPQEGVIGRVKSFVDGLTSWAHMQMS
ncbi:uncharacterized protein BJ171DRAFT_569284 [Polychytrium aggregatum]|uniref:uncharacterized protein n=1 Tax=Polychytrium aggregatum TaxID=110093 RepID=UPI0022FF1C5E|nr:uncharacterized protein BJ171DRAFT_569284 [Polychytrium aggregatum]KAI9203034.1 hypothetical protein BJ171DRAFT_569284 [Polychytrium aggregatum]